MNENKHTTDGVGKFAMRLIGLASAAILYCLPCAGQTNVVCFATRFFEPPLELRTQLAPGADKPMQAKTTQPDFSNSHEPVAFKTLLDDDELDSPIFRHAQAYLKQLQAPSDAWAARSVDMLFKPDVIRLGKASLSCPIVTVIKRKNPLCLLSGFVTDPTLSAEGGIAFRLIDLSW